MAITDSSSSSSPPTNHHSQFFITLDAFEWLNNKYTLTIFGNTHLYDEDDNDKYDEDDDDKYDDDDDTDHYCSQVRRS